MTLREKKFVELAEKRVNKAIKQLRLIGNLANKSNYTYNSRQSNKIISRLNSELMEIKSMFRRNERSKTEDFKI